MIAHAPRQPLRPELLGMAFFIVSESVLFSMLFVAYFYLRSGVDSWPPPGVERPRLLLPAIGSILLFSSSATAQFAERSAARDASSWLRAGLAATFLLGAAFLGIQAAEWSGETFSASDNVYTSLFFTVTGFHAAHVLLGLGMNAFVQAQSWTDRLNLSGATVSNIVWYWHFVDVVWIFVLAIVYLSPYYLGAST